MHSSSLFFLRDNVGEEIYARMNLLYCLLGDSRSKGSAGKILKWKRL